MIQDNIRDEWIEEFERYLQDDYHPGMLVNWRQVKEFLSSDYNTWAKRNNFNCYRGHFLLKDLVKFIQENGIHEDRIQR